MPLFSLSPTFPQKVSAMFPDQTVSDVAGPYPSLAETRGERHGWCVSAETVRRRWQALGWRGKRTQLAAQDNDPDRVPKLARLRRLWESLRPRPALLFADELEIALLPKPGYQGRKQGTPVEVRTPGQNQKRY
jgi:hypothetical protein